VVDLNLAELYAKQLSPIDVSNALTRIEHTEMRVADVEQDIRNTLPAGEIDTILDNIGIPNAWGSLAQGDVPNIAATDAEILTSLNHEQHGPVRDYEDGIDAA
jgi:hypothetical protein